MSNVGEQVWRECKFIRFVVAEPYGTKFTYNIINTRHRDCLGRVCWYPAWRQWVATFEDMTVWSADCLADVQGFLTWLKEQP